MSTITDVVFVIPTTFNGHADRFADIFERYPIGFFGGGTEAHRPEPVENTGTRASNSTVFHIAVNRLDLDVLEAIKAEPWPRGTILSYQTDEYDRYPTVVVWGEDGPIEHAWPICQLCGCPERTADGPHDCLYRKAMGGAALTAEPVLLANPDAEPLDGYNTPGEPMNPADLERVMQDMYGRAAPYGAPEFSWWRRPARRVNLFRLRGEQARQSELSAWREAGRAAWIEGVRERLQSAVYAASNGYGWSWTGPGVFGVPGQPEWLEVRDATQPWRPAGWESSC